MKKISLLIGPAIFIALCAVGCSGGDGAEASNAELIDKYNKNLPPIDPNAPPPKAPVREDMGGGNMPQKGGK